MAMLTTLTIVLITATTGSVAGGLLTRWEERRQVQPRRLWQTVQA
jgi:hypothetical protein